MYLTSIIAEIMRFILDPYSHEFSKYYLPEYPIIQRAIEEWIAELEQEKKEQFRLETIKCQKIMEQQKNNSSCLDSTYNFQLQPEKYKLSGGRYYYCHCGYESYQPYLERFENVHLYMNIELPYQFDKDKKSEYYGTQIRKYTFDFDKNHIYIFGKNKKNRNRLNYIRGIHRNIWIYLSMQNDLPMDFIIDFKDCLSWHHLSKNYTFTYREIEKLKDYICWDNFNHKKYEDTKFCPCYLTFDINGIRNNFNPIRWSSYSTISCPIKLAIHIKLIQELKLYWEIKEQKKTNLVDYY